MYCAVYTCKTLRKFNDDDLIKLFQTIQQKNIEHHITGCLVHFGDEFFQVVQGQAGNVNALYTLDGVDNRVRYGEPIFTESGCPFLFEFSYVVSEKLHNTEGAADIPVLNHNDLYLLHDVLGTQTLALTFFWKCLEQLLNERKENKA